MAIGKEDLMASLRIFLTTTAAMVSIVGTAVGGAWVLTRLYDSLEGRVETLETKLEKAPALRSSRNSPVDEMHAAPDTSECPPAMGDGNVIRLSVPVEDSLTNTDERLVDGAHFKDWILFVCDASTLVIEMRSSELDSFVYLSEGRRDSTTWNPIGADDDSGGDLNAQLISSVSPGPHTITATTFGQGEGPYTLSVREYR